MMKRRILAVLALIVMGAIGVWGVSDNTYALDKSQIAKKWAFVTWRQCAANGKMKTPLATNEQSGGVAGSLVTQDAWKVALPSFQFIGSGSEINCYDNFMGSGGTTGVINYAGISGSTQWSDASGAKSIVEGKLKYDFAQTGDEYFNIFATRTSQLTTFGLFGGTQSPQEGQSHSVKVVPTGNGKYRLDGGFMENELHDINLETTSSSLKVRLNVAFGCVAKFSNQETEIPFKSDIKEFRNAVNSALEPLTWGETCSTEMTSTDYTFKFGAEAVHEGSTGVYRWMGRTNDAVKEMAGVELKDLNLDNNERYVLYKHYLEKAISSKGGQLNCDEEKSGDGWMKVKLKVGGEFKVCYASFNSSNASETAGQIKVSDISASRPSAPTITEISLASVIGWLNSVDESTLTDVDVVTNGDATDSGGSADVTCASSGAAGSLGWIVCPIMDWLGGAAQDLYNGVVKNALQVEPELFTGGGGGTKQGWETFRNIANVVFIILFMVVIFSQLTGVGIDNYGIKKILPKLIISAILINLSYWICIVFVDLSNILGNSFQALFNGLAAGLNPSSTVVGADAFSSAGATIVSVIIIGIIVAGAGVAIALNPAILLAMVVGAIGVVISVLFLFVLLSVREAAIVVLVVISPLAVVCYMLPNTKSMFDKWLKFFEGLLLVYPICGLLIGGGNYVSRLLLASGVGDGGIFSAVTAMIIGIVPIFFIPTVLRQSFSAMGTIGTRLAGLGREVSGRATNRMRNSNAYKNAQERGLERQTRIRGGIDKNGVPVTGGRRAVASFLSGGRRGRQRSALQYQKMVADRGSLEAADAPEFMTATQTANVMKELNATGAINDMGAMNVDANGNYAGGGGSGLTGGLYSALISGDKARIRAYTDALSAKGEDGRNAVKAAYNAAVGNGMSGESAKAFADNIMANHAADYKNNNRSMFAVAQGINSGSGPVQTTEQYMANGGQAALASKVTSNTIGNMDDEAFAETFSADANGNLMPAGMSDEDKKSIGATAYAALNDQNANIKADRRAALEKLVAESGYTPQARDVNVTNDILDVREAGHVADARGNTYKVHRNINGGVSDEGGFEIDPTQFNAR